MHPEYDEHTFFSMLQSKLNMSKTKLNIIILLSVLSPIPISFLSSVGQNPQSYSGPAGITGIFFGVPAIAIIGLTISLIVRKNPNAYKFTAIGYVVPAVIICGLLILSFIMSATQS